MIAGEAALFNEQECLSIINSIKTNHQIWKGLDRKYSSFAINLSSDNQWVFERIKAFFEKNTGIEISSMKNQIHYHEYSEGEYFLKHNDSRDSRLYSVGCLLNDDFTGGDLNLYNPELITLKRTVGNGYFFDVRIGHEITPILSGKRKSMICFLQSDHIKTKAQKII
jgi:hypothetical protein